MTPRRFWIASVIGLVSCDPVRDIARFKVVPSDAREGVPCAVALTSGDDAPSIGRPTTRTGAAFIVHTYRPVGRYRVALQCDGYALATSQLFEWNGSDVVDLGAITVTPRSRAVASDSQAAEQRDEPGEARRPL